MKRVFLFLFFTSMMQWCAAQNFRGQWKGYFIDQSVSALSYFSSRSDYVLDLDVDGDKVTGSSYTYFTSNGNKYYTICTLTGTANKKNKTVTVTETSRTKTNVPDDISNSFQVHTLHWRKQGDTEILEGKWVPAPNQDVVNTGYGSTYLVKRQLTEISALAKKVNQKRDPESAPMAFAAPVVKKPGSKPVAAAKKKSASPATSHPVAKKRITPKPVVKKPVAVIPPIVKAPEKAPEKDSSEAAKPEIAKKDSAVSTQVHENNSAENLVPGDFQKRTTSLVQTVIVENPTVRVEIYDDGVVDGDSISLFYNGKVLLAHKMLSLKPILLEIPVSNDETDELVMFADNLGTIPPNTALMIVYDGVKRYEVRMSSDLSKSGEIRFVRKEPGPKTP